jgi:hypothetical protein
LVAPRGEHIDSDDDLAFDIGTVLQVVGRSKAAVSHLHDGRVGVCGQGPCAFRFLALPSLDLGQPVQGGLDPNFAFFGRVCSGGFPASVVGARVVILLLLEFRYPLLRGFQVVLEFDYTRRHETGQIDTQQAFQEVAIQAAEGGRGLYGAALG